MNLDLIYPMAAMVLLTFGVAAKMFLTRVAAVKGGEASAGFYKTYQEGSEPRHAAQLSRHFSNLFETPTLFYTACVVGLVTGIYASVLVGLAWLYVVCRLLHAIVHIGANKIPNRIRSFFLSLAVLLGMWGTLVVGVAAGQ